MIAFSTIIDLFAKALTGIVDNNLDNLPAYILKNIETNLLLWKFEDLARRKNLGVESIAMAKCEIDKHNQVRNDFIRLIDLELVKHVTTSEINPHTTFHAESPGMLIDRLAILLIKYAKINSVVPIIENSQLKNEYLLKINELKHQIKDTGEFLDILLKNILSGEAYFKVYNPLKLYNDNRIRDYLDFINNNHIVDNPPSYPDFL